MANILFDAGFFDLICVKFVESNCSLIAAHLPWPLLFIALEPNVKLVL